MCLTIDKPFFTALICGKCLNNVHGKADYSSCFEIGGSQMKADKPCGTVSRTAEVLTRTGSSNHPNPIPPRLAPHAGTSRS